jgi:cyclohexa-1,5-dienecarbonyl-CoA hydratase
LIKTTELYNGQVTEICLGPPRAYPQRPDDGRTLSRAGNGHGCAAQKLLIFTGTGKHFSFGASVEEHTADKVGAMLPKFHKLIGALLECPVPALAKVRGVCLGGAFELALACPLLFCEEGAALGVPEIQLGVFPPAASILLPHKIGFALAAQMTSPARIRGNGTQTPGIGQRGGRSWQTDETAVFAEKQVLPKSAVALRLANQATRLSLVKHFREHIQEVERLYLIAYVYGDAVEASRCFRKAAAQMEG